MGDFIGAVAAHEIGHNFNMRHDDMLSKSQLWPSSIMRIVVNYCYAG